MWDIDSLEYRAISDLVLSYPNYRLFMEGGLTYDSLMKSLDIDDRFWYCLNFAKDLYHSSKMCIALAMKLWVDFYELEKIPDPVNVDRYLRMQPELYYKYLYNGSELIQKGLGEFTKKSKYDEVQAIYECNRRIEEGFKLR